MGDFLLVIGITLILFEAFIPGFGVFGVSGFLSLIAGIIMTSPNLYYAIAVIALIVIVFALIFAFILKKFPKSFLFKTLFLKTNLSKEEGYLSSKENSQYIGQIMTVDSFLRPSGKVKKDGKIYEAMSEAEFIEKNEKVEVIGNKGYILLVKRYEGR